MVTEAVAFVPYRKSIENNIYIDITCGTGFASFVLNHVTNVIYRMHFEVIFMLKHEDYLDKVHECIKTSIIWH